MMCKEKVLNDINIFDLAIHLLPTIIMNEILKMNIVKASKLLNMCAKSYIHNNKLYFL